MSRPLCILSRQVIVELAQEHPVGAVWKNTWMMMGAEKQSPNINELRIRDDETISLTQPKMGKAWDCRLELGQSLVDLLKWPFRSKVRERFFGNGSETAQEDHITSHHITSHRHTIKQISNWFRDITSSYIEQVFN